ncbi:putative alpha/beta-fold hydrolase [Paraburkholderia sp. 32]
MSDEINRRRRRLLGSAAIGVGALSLGLNGWANAQSVAGNTNGSDAPRPASFATIKQIDAGVLNIGYAQVGPADGPVVILLHGWPYDIHSFADASLRIASAGYRVIVPHLRGYGAHRRSRPD